MALNSNITSTWTFDPSLGSAVIAAYSRCGVRRTEITTQHMADAEAEANYLMSAWQGDGINLFQVDLVTLPLIAGVSEYNVPNTTVFTLDMYIRVNPGQYNPIDRLITQISRSDYAAIANKQMPGMTTCAWINKQLNPVMYLWPVPNIDGMELRYYVQKRAMDEFLTNGQQIAVPYECYDAFVWGLAERLAFIYTPDRVAMISPRAMQAYQKMLQATTEPVPLEMQIQVGSYFRVG
jgi:hypothetical protein